MLLPWTTVISLLTGLLTSLLTDVLTSHLIGLQSLEKSLKYSKLSPALEQAFALAVPSA